MDNPSKWFNVFTQKVGVGNVIITPHMMEMLRIVRTVYDKKTYDFMIENLGLKSEIDFLKDYNGRIWFINATNYSIYEKVANIYKRE